MGDCSRAYGDGYYGDCLYGGADATIPGYISFPGPNSNVLTVPGFQPGITEAVTMIVETRTSILGTGSGDADVIMSQRLGSDVAWWDLRVTSGGSLQLYTNPGGGASNISVTVASNTELSVIPANEWVHIAVVVIPDDGGGNRRLRAYWSQDGMGTWTPLSSLKGGPSFSIPATFDFSIGAHLAGANAYTGDFRYVSFQLGTNGDLPGGAPIFEFNGTEIVDPNAASFIAVSDQMVSVARNANPNNALVIYPAIPGDCELCFTNDPCPQQIPDSSSHMDRWDQMVPCSPGGDC